MPDAVPLIDPFARPITYLRVSVTDRCDFLCTYCMSEHMQFLPKADLLTLEELERLSSAFVDLGVRKLRITGGEPLVRRNIMSFFEAMAQRLGNGLDELTLTTNGTMLAHRARDLAACGVRRINVSLDTLRADHVSSYGYRRKTTPFFDRLAERTRTYDRHYVGSMPCMPARRDLMSLRDLRVPSSAGPVPLEAVADVSLSAGATQIERYDRRYQTKVSANLVDGALLGPVNAQVARIAPVEMPVTTSKAGRLPRASRQPSRKPAPNAPRCPPPDMNSMAGAAGAASGPGGGAGRVAAWRSTSMRLAAA